jgi:hypothetical protein
MIYPEKRRATACGAAQVIKSAGRAVKAGKTAFASQPSRRMNLLYAAPVGE